MFAVGSSGRYFGAIVDVDEHFTNCPFAPRQRFELELGDAIAAGELMLLDPLIDGDIDDGAHFMNLPLALRHWVFGIGEGDAANAAVGRTIDAASAAIERMRRDTRCS